MSNEMEISYGDLNDDSLVLKEVNIVNDSSDCLDNSPYLKSLPPAKQVNGEFKLSRKRLNCETESPVKPGISNNLFKTQFTSVSAKKWRSASYNPMTSSPKAKFEPIKRSPFEPIANCKMFPNQIVKPINPTINSTINSTLDNLMMISNLNVICQKSNQQVPTLMGDYSSTYALPLISGRHKDLKTITPETLANLIKGEHKLISCFTIIDARYPYEFNGGHIDGSKNLYHREEINSFLWY